MASRGSSTIIGPSGKPAVTGAALSLFEPARCCRASPKSGGSGGRETCRHTGQRSHPSQPSERSLERRAAMRARIRIDQGCLRHHSAASGQARSSPGLEVDHSVHPTTKTGARND